MHPFWFVAFGVLVVVLVVFAWALARISALADAAATERDLSVPARASTPARQDPAGLPLGSGSGPGRTARSAAQERAARAAVRPRPSRLDVAPVQCPLDRGDGC
jgi:hypothetical protein